MERVACVDVPALPLQLLLRTRPDWRDHPTVVVADDRPQAPVVWANALARSHRILPGMSFAAAQSLARELRASTVAPEDIERIVGELHVALCNFSPRVEPCTREPGVFWLDPSGLVPLYGSLEEWAETLVRDLGGRGFEGVVTVGFHRYRSYALARARGLAASTGRSAPTWILPDPHTESRQAARVPLESLAVSPRLRDQLRVLGVRTLGDLLRLPPTELRSRFGEEAADLHAQASDRFTPLVPRVLVDPVGTRLQFEPPDADHTRLLFGLKGALHRLMKTLADRGRAMSALRLQFELDHAPGHQETIEPAAPTLDVPMVVDLVRLRLESLALPAAIEELEIELEGIEATAEQLSLFAVRSKRDLDAGARALARLRASLGDGAVRRARLRAAHLPEAGFTWEGTTVLRFPHPVGLPDDAPSPLVRRMFCKPVPLPPRPRHEPEAWLGHRGAVTRMSGPFRISGGWWVRTVERDYYYVETQNQDILWVFYDRPRRRWFLHAIVD